MADDGAGRRQPLPQPDELTRGLSLQPASPSSPQTPTDFITSWYASSTVSSERCW